MNKILLKQSDIDMFNIDILSEHARTVLKIKSLYELKKILDKKDYILIGD